MKIDPGEERVDVGPEGGGSAERDQDVKEVTRGETRWVEARWPMAERTTVETCSCLVSVGVSKGWSALCEFGRCESKRNERQRHRPIHMPRLPAHNSMLVASPPSSILLTRCYHVRD